MYTSEVFLPKYAGTPAGYRRIGFRWPDGSPLVALVKMPEDWNVSVLVEEDTRRVFLVGSSADNTKACVTRWLKGHAPATIECDDAAAQLAAFGGKTAATASHEELVAEASTALTAEDKPFPLPPSRPVKLVPIEPDEIVAASEGKKRKRVFRGYHFREQRYDDGKRTVVDCHLSPPLRFATKSSESKLLGAFRNGISSAYFVFDDGVNYLLECVRLRGGHRVIREEARAPKRSHAGQTPQQVAEALIPSLGAG